MYRAALTVLSGLTLAAAQTTTTTLVPDPPVTFWAQLYNTTADCSGSADFAYLGSMGTCVNVTVSGSGSAIMVIGEESVYYLSAYTGRGCTGDVVFVEQQLDTCIDFEGLGAQSFSNDDSVFGNK